MTLTTKKLLDTARKFSWTATTLSIFIKAQGNHTDYFSRLPPGKFPSVWWIFLCVTVWIIIRSKIIILFRIVVVITCSVTFTQVPPDLCIKKTNCVMSKLSIVLDLRLLGKMWHGTRDEQTPQQVRMTLGNKGAIHLPTLCFQWSFLFGFQCCALVYPRAATGNQHGVNAVFICESVLIGHCFAAELHGL